MFFVYVIKSISRNYIYVGLSSDLTKRIDDHHKGYNKTTKPYSPFLIIFTEEFQTRVDARKREKYLKSGVGKEYIKSFLAMHHFEGVAP